MPYKITDRYAACSEYERMCPIGAIEPGASIFVINDSCSDFELCLVACDFDAIELIGDSEDEDAQNIKTDRDE